MKHRGMGKSVRGGGCVGKGASEPKYFRNGGFVKKPVRKMQGGGMAGGIGGLPQRPPLPAQANPAAVAALAQRRPMAPQIPQRPMMPMRRGGRVKG